MSLFEVIHDQYGPRTAASYDKLAHQLFWGYAEVLEAMASEIVFGRHEDLSSALQIRRILDAGMGTGNLSSSLLRALNKASWVTSGQPPADGPISIVGFDGSSNMLNEAKNKLETVGNVVLSIVTGKLESLRDAFQGESQGDGGFDVVMSSFAVHHLTGAQKAKFFRDAYQMLNPGGVIVVGDKMTQGDSKIDRNFHRVMCSRIPLLFEKQMGSVSYSEILDEVQKQFDADGDQPSTIREHLEWASGAGFHDVRCPYQSFGNAIVSGKKPL